MVQDKKVFRWLWVGLASLMSVLFLIPSIFKIDALVSAYKRGSLQLGKPGAALDCASSLSIIIITLSTSVFVMLVAIGRAQGNIKRSKSAIGSAFVYLLLSCMVGGAIIYAVILPLIRWYLGMS